MKIFINLFALLILITTETSWSYRQNRSAEAAAGRSTRMAAQFHRALAADKNRTSVVATTTEVKSSESTQEQLRIGVEYTRAVEGLEFNYKFESVQVVESTTGTIGKYLQFKLTGWACVKGPGVMSNSNATLALGGWIIAHLNRRDSEVCGQDGVGNRFELTSSSVPTSDDSFTLAISYGEYRQSTYSGVTIPISEGSSFSQFVGAAAIAEYNQRRGEILPEMNMNYYDNGYTHQAYWTIHSYERAGIESRNDMLVCVEVRNSSGCNLNTFAGFVSISTQNEVDTRNPIQVRSFDGRVEVSQSFLVEHYTQDPAIIRAGFTIYYKSSFGHVVSKSFGGE